MKIKQTLLATLCAASFALTGCTQATDSENVNPNLKKDEPEFFSKSGAAACVGGALLSGLACLLVKDDHKEVCIAAAAAGCAVGISSNYFLDKLRSDYSNLEDQLDASKAQIQKSIASTKSLKTTTQELINDDSAEADKIIADIKAGKKDAKALQAKIKEMEDNFAYMSKRLEQDKEVYKAHNDTQESLLTGVGGKAAKDTRLAKQKNQEVTLELQKANEELALLENSVISYGQKTAQYKKQLENLS